MTLTINLKLPTPFHIIVENRQSADNQTQQLLEKIKMDIDELTAQAVKVKELLEAQKAQLEKGKAEIISAIAELKKTVRIVTPEAEAAMANVVAAASALGVSTQEIDDIIADVPAPAPEPAPAEGAVVLPEGPSVPAAPVTDAEPLPNPVDEANAPQG